MTKASGSPGERPPSPTPPEEETELLLLGRIADRPFALPASSVERILPMAAITRLPDLPGGVVGVLNLHGSILPVVDLRPSLGLPTPRFHPHQRLVVISGSTRYLLWVDAVEQTLPVAPHSFSTIGALAAERLFPHVVQLSGEAIPVLSPEAMDPGPVIRQAMAP